MINFHYGLPLGISPVDSCGETIIPRAHRFLRAFLRTVGGDIMICLCPSLPEAHTPSPGSLESTRSLHPRIDLGVLMMVGGMVTAVGSVKQIAGW